MAAPALRAEGRTDAPPPGPAASPSAADKKEKRRRRPHRPAWRSPLTRRILLVNILVLLIPVLGLLHLEQYRQSLIDSDLEAMRTQATTVALALGSAAVQDGLDGDQQLMHETARQLIRVLLGKIGRAHV